MLNRGKFRELVREEAFRLEASLLGDIFIGSPDVVIVHFVVPRARGIFFVHLVGGVLGSRNL